MSIDVTDDDILESLEYAIFAIEQLGSDPEVLRGMLKEAEGE